MLSPKKKDRKPKKKRLGRGLSSLMGEPVKVSVDEVLPPSPRQESFGVGQRVEADQTDSAESRDPIRRSNGPDSVFDEESEDASGEAGDRIRFIRLDEIIPNLHQPRQHANEENLKALTDSIRTAGVMQPVLVRPREDGIFEIVAGERRWSAARMAGLESIPAIVRDLDTRESAEWALVENIQREDLNPIDKAEAFQSLIDSFNLTQTQVAERVGIDRASVANFLRLNYLDEKTKDDIRVGRLTQGHAKVLLGISDPDARRKLAEVTMLGKWSVRELEQRVNQLLREAAVGVRGPSGESSGRVGRSSVAGAKPEHVRALESELSTFLGMKAEIRLGRTRSSGKLIVTFKNIHEFESLVKNLRDARP